MDVALAHYPLCMMGGGERVVLQIAKRFNPVIYTTNYSREALPEFREFDVRILSPHARAMFPDARPGDPGTVVSHMGYLHSKIREGYDVLNAHGTPSQWLAARNPRVSWYCHVPFISYSPEFREKYERAGICSSLWNGFSHSLDRAVAGRICTICANSEFTKAGVERFIGRRDASVLHPGIEPHEFSCEDYGRNFLCLGRITPQKRVEYAIDAFRRFGRRGWKLKIVGTPMHGQEGYLAWLRNRARGCDVEFDISPSQAGIKRAYASCCAALSCGADEAWGLVPIEAMASSKPVISVNEGGPRESIIDGETGFLVGSADEMAGKMRFLADHPDVCEKMGRAGRRHVVKNYTRRKFLDGLERVFKRTAKM